MSKGSADNSSRLSAHRRARAVVQHVTLRIAEARVEELQARYDLGRIFHRIRYAESREWPCSTLEYLARCLGLHASVLRRYARISEAISRTEFVHFAKLRDSHGLPLTWSHLEKLARIRDRAHRRARAEDIVAGASGIISVREAARLCVRVAVR